MLSAGDARQPNPRQANRPCRTVSQARKTILNITLRTRLKLLILLEFCGVKGFAKTAPKKLKYGSLKANVPPVFYSKIRAATMFSFLQSTGLTV